MNWKYVKDAEKYHCNNIFDKVIFYVGVFIGYIEAKIGLVKNEDE